MPAGPALIGDLREPLYGLACSHELADHVLAPLLDPAVEHRDPFASWFWLWRHGRALRFDEVEGSCTVVPAS